MSSQSNQEWFEGFFGPVANILNRILAPAHIVSFLTGTGLFFTLYWSQAVILGLDKYDLTFWICWALAVATAAVIEAVHIYVPDRFFRMAFSPVDSIHKRGVMAYAAFTVLALLTIGMTLVSSLTSAGGAAAGMEYVYEDPPPPDISGETAAMQADTAGLAETYGPIYQSINTRYDAKRDSAAAYHTGQIGSLNSALQGHRQDHARGNQWAQSWIDRRNREISAQRAAQIAAVARIESERLAALAPEQTREAEARRSLVEAYQFFVQTTNENYNKLLESERAQAATNKAWAHGIGLYLVWFILGVKGLLTGYHVASGHPPREFVFKKMYVLSRLVAAIKGIFIDKADHVVQRVEITRQQRAERHEVRAYSLPGGGTMARSGAVLFALFAAMQLPDLNLGVSELSIVPYPWNWVLALLAVAGLVLAFGKGFKTTSRAVETTKDSLQTSNNPVEDNNIEQPETLVRQESQGQNVVPEDEDLTALVSDPAAINKLIDAANKNYVRQYTSATQTARDRNADRYKKRADLLRKIGYHVSASGPKEKKHVKLDGKPRTVTYNKLEIRE
ncbi:MAG: hypothetical protein AAFP08_01945 [Bacteroidota bacterium]